MNIFLNKKVDQQRDLINYFKSKLGK